MLILLFLAVLYLKLIPNNSSHSISNKNNLTDSDLIHIISILAKCYLIKNDKKYDNCAPPLKGQ